MFVLTFLILTIGGAWPVDEPYASVTRLFSLCYFLFFLLYHPLRAYQDKIISSLSIGPIRQF